ncbi:MAG: hypothetical protein AAFO69_14455, partial [Bacteroidota bacterium]
LESYKENRKHFEEYIRSDEEEKAVNEALTKVSSFDEDFTTEEINDDPEESATPIATEKSDSTDGVTPNEETEEEDDDEFNLSAIINEIKKDQEVQENLPEKSSTSNKIEEKPKSEEAKADTVTEKPAYKSKIVISGSNKKRQKSSDEVKTEGSKIIPSAEAAAKVNDESVADEQDSQTADANPEESVTQADTGLVSREENEKNQNEEENLSPGALRKAKMKRLKMQRDIIEDFIDTSPQMPSPARPTPGEPEEDTATDLSADSQVTEEEIVSENMAIIYKNQGKNQKAIDIYKKLILKFPEKEAYFAARIKDLK